MNCKVDERVHKFQKKREILKEDTISTHAIHQKKRYNFLFMVRLQFITMNYSKC